MMTDPCRAALAELVTLHETALKFIAEEDHLSTKLTAIEQWDDFDQRFAAFNEAHDAAWAAARSALAQEAVPPGFVMVPKEPTEEMLLAMYAADWDASASNRRDLARLRMEPAYRAALASVPQPQDTKERT